MTFQLLRPEILPPEALDALLASGWYRMRQSVFTCRYLLGRRGLHTAVWTRLPLRGYQFRPSLRRRMRRIHADLEVTTSSMPPGEEHEELYARYVDHVGGDRAETLHDVLYDDDQPGVLFQTRQIQVRHQGRLVAYSFFDEGRDSLQSVIGVYDPAYARYGLGVGTMLLEVRYGLEHGYRYHYAGYVVPGVPAFDYKREVGPLQYYDPDTHAWRPLDALEDHHLPASRLRWGLDQVASRLRNQGIPCRLRCYPPYRVVYMNDLQDRCLSSPLFLECGRAVSDDVSLVVSHDPTAGTWAVEAYHRSRDLSELLGEAPAPDAGPPADLSLLVRLDRAGVTPSPDEAARWVARALGRGPWRCVEP